MYNPKSHTGTERAEDGGIMKRVGVTLKHGQTLMTAHYDSAKLNQNAHHVLNKNNKWRNIEWNRNRN